MIATSGLHERSTGPKHAVDLLHDVARRCDFSLSIETTGRMLETSSCLLTDSLGRSSIGRGKGIGEQSLASAISEALEHYFHSYENNVSEISTQRFQFSTSHYLERASPDFQLIFGEEPVTFDCFEFASFCSGYSSLAFPAVLQNPAYRSQGTTERDVVQTSRIFRYATNSGTATGLSQQDACLHGLLETIERDAIGLTLLRSVVASKPSAVREIEPTSLLPETAKLSALVASEAGATAIQLWDITSDTNIPTILCGLELETSLGSFRYFGSGTSLSAAYAVERALLESLQGYHVHQNLGGFELSPVDPNPEDKMSLYRRCELDAGYFEVRGGRQLIDFATIPNYGAMAIPDQITFIVNRLNKIGCPAYSRSIYRSPQFAVEQVIVPNFERFYLVAHGISVAPSWRGRQLLETAV